MVASRLQSGFDRSLSFIHCRRLIESVDHDKNIMFTCTGRQKVGFHDSLLSHS